MYKDAAWDYEKKAETLGLNTPNISPWPSCLFLCSQSSWPPATNTHSDHGSSSRGYSNAYCWRWSLGANLGIHARKIGRYIKTHRILPQPSNCTPRETDTQLNKQSSLIIESYPTRLDAPKAHALSSRTLEICRQFGLDVNEIRRMGTKVQYTCWVNFVTNLSGKLLGSLEYERMHGMVLDETPTVRLDFRLKIIG